MNSAQDDIVISLTPQQLEWLGQVFLDSDTTIKIDIDPEATFEQQLADAGAFDHEEVDMIDIEAELRDLLDQAGIPYDGGVLAQLARPIQQHIVEAAE